ncbi:hypothetical protein [Haloarchaeobius iranensis]|uniref:Uncharacterized protein n=1 Tax=Haloarchaeobius iranensis TaxID=996166 RepID=A0A1G9Y7I8_9EURY|nr:hypothetical protein [Haloarchaeobius iranensis]SDN05038.1 hypothetical protein SAMN05192554_11345 [Haloarchaeobius iranensis]
MSWEALFDRAAAYDVTVDDVRATLTERRAASADDPDADEEGGDGR